MTDDKAEGLKKALQTNHIIFNLLLCFWLLCFAFILATSNNVNYLHFFMFGGVVFCMAWAYNLSTMSGLIVAMIVVFVYGSYLLYAVMVTGEISGLRPDYVIWLFIIPVGTFLAGQLGSDFMRLRRKIETYATLEDISPIDHVTGFLNGKGFFARLDEEVNKARRFQTPLATMYIKIGNIYEVQSIYGHEGLMEIIRVLADIISDDLRQYDLKGLLEDNSFAVLLPGSGAAGADICVHRLYKKTEKIIVNVGGSKKVIRLKVGIGKAEYDYESKEEGLIFFDRAKEDSRYDMG